MAACVCVCLCCCCCCWHLKIWTAGSLHGIVPAAALQCCQGVVCCVLHEWRLQPPKSGTAASTCRSPRCVVLLPLSTYWHSACSPFQLLEQCDALWVGLGACVHTHPPAPAVAAADACCGTYVCCCPLLLAVVFDDETEEKINAQLYQERYEFLPVDGEGEESECACVCPAGTADGRRHHPLRLCCWVHCWRGVA